jgi:hypothetical protein
MRLSGLSRKKNRLKGQDVRPEAAEIILFVLKFRIPPNAFHDDWQGEIRRILRALNRTFYYGDAPWNQYRVEAC